MACFQGYDESCDILDFGVGRNLVLQVRILALKVGMPLFHGPNLVLSQCTVLFLSLWFLCIYLLVLISGVARARLSDES